VDAVGADGDRQVRAVVDDQQRTRLIAAAPEPAPGGHQLLV
jgi:hypothetical protein